jgi:hypothetical protein
MGYRAIGCEAQTSLGVEAHSATRKSRWVVFEISGFNVADQAINRCVALAAA